MIQAFILAVEFSTQSGKFLLEAYVYKSSLSMSLSAANNFCLSPLYVILCVSLRSFYSLTCRNLLISFQAPFANDHSF